MRKGLLATSVAGLFLVGPACAGPWAEVGDSTLRSDVELLASAGAVDNITTQWPLPWAGLMDRLNTPGSLVEQPDYIRDAAARVRALGETETKNGAVHASVLVDLASTPAFVRGYDALGRQTAQTTASLEYVWSTTVIHLSLGAQTIDRHDHQVFVADGSYIAQRLGDTVVYAGYMPHWWGPGWISALSQSTNARPVPQVGISRVSTMPFESPWLSWIGPWQLEFFVGVLDGPRIQRHTIYDGLRFTFSPLPHFEVGITRTDEMCGQGHTCKPLVNWFNPNNDPKHVNDINDELDFDFRYTGAMNGWNYAVYTQVMNEDNNPIIHSGTSHLFGATVWAPIEDGIGRFTMEYTDSVATRDIWGSGTFPGFAYNNGTYPDGMRYRDRTLGFSLDSDSRLFSLQGDYLDRTGIDYRLTFHHAEISTPKNTAGNVVTTAPVLVNMVQGRIGLPFQMGVHPVRFEVEGRLQDDQPRPDKGFLASIEAALRFNL